MARSGAVRASVTVHDKYASGSGRLSSNSGGAGGTAIREVRAVQGTGPLSGTNAFPLAGDF